MLTGQVSVSLSSVAGCLLVPETEIAQTHCLHRQRQLDHRMAHYAKYVTQTLKS